MTTMHPSGLTLERWLWPFKTEAERKLIVIWLNHGLDPSITNF